MKIEEFGSRDTLIDQVKRRRRKKIQHILIERREVDQLSCNRGRVWPDLENAAHTHTHIHRGRVTGHKERLCQVTEHRGKDKGLEGCDMTNMRSSAGLRGDWCYSQRWLTLLICITHQSRSQQQQQQILRRAAAHMYGQAPSAWKYAWK